MQQLIGNADVPCGKYNILLKIYINFIRIQYKSFSKPSLFSSHVYCFYMSPSYRKKKNNSETNCTVEKYPAGS